MYTFRYLQVLQGSFMPLKRIYLQRKVKAVHLYDRMKGKLKLMHCHMFQFLLMYTPKISFEIIQIQFLRITQI